MPPYGQNDLPSGQPPQNDRWGWIWKVLPVVGSIAGSLIDKGSQDAANKANAKNVADQIAFQREQSSTQYQRAVADMRSAGLNPALAYKQGGNAAESGAAAEARPSMTNSAEKLRLAVAAYNEFANGTAQRQLIREQASREAATTRKIALEASALQPEANLGVRGDYQELHYRTRMKRLKADAFMADETPTQFRANLGATQQQTATARQQELLMKTQATLNEQEYMNEWFRKNIAPYINSSSRAFRAFRGLEETTGLTPIRRYW